MTAKDAKDEKRCERHAVEWTCQTYGRSSFNKHPCHRRNQLNSCFAPALELAFNVVARLKSCCTNNLPAYVFAELLYVRKWLRELRRLRRLRRPDPACLSIIRYPLSQTVYTCENDCERCESQIPLRKSHSKDTNVAIYGIQNQIATTPVDQSGSKLDLEWGLAMTKLMSPEGFDKLKMGPEGFEYHPLPGTFKQHLFNEGIGEKTRSPTCTALRALQCR